MRMAVIADIHGNLLALEAVLRDAKDFAPDLMVDLGDCISGPLWPRETFERLEALSLPTVRGNHDRRVATDHPDRMGASDRFAWERLSSKQRESLGRFPLLAEFSAGITGFHATPKHDERYLLDSIRDGRLVRAPMDRIEARLAGLNAKTILCAHSHRQELVSLSSGMTIVNPGSIGCPAYTDPTGHPHVSEAGTPHARYAIIDCANASVKNVMFRCISYDHESAAQQAISHGRPDWAHALRTGFMPAS